MAIRINRFLSAAGLGSRRSVEALVVAGRVTLNGTALDSLSVRVDTDHDVVMVDGRIVKAESASRLILYFKEWGVVSSFARQADERCLQDIFPPEDWPGRLFHVGRLDRDSTGLLLLSDDGDLAHHLTHPSHPVWKCYNVKTYGDVSEESLRLISDGGILLDGKPTLPLKLKVLGERHFELQLREGRNRQIRRLFNEVDVKVEQLHRTAFGPLQLGEMRPGQWRDASQDEWDLLRKSVSEDHSTDIDELHRAD